MGHNLLDLGTTSKQALVGVGAVVSGVGKVDRRWVESEQKRDGNDVEFRVCLQTQPSGGPGQEHGMMGGNLLAQ